MREVGLSGGRGKEREKKKEEKERGNRSIKGKNYKRGTIETNTYVCTNTNS